MPKPKLATPSNVTQMPAAEVIPQSIAPDAPLIIGKLRLFPFFDAPPEGVEPSIDVPPPADMPGGAMSASQFQSGGKWYFYNGGGHLIEIDSAMWENEKMQAVIAAMLPTPPVIPGEVVPEVATVTAGVVAPKPGVYPKQTERRYLKAPLTKGERDEAGEKLARLVRNIEDIESEKNAANARFGARLKDAKKEQSDVSHLVTDGFREKGVECVWLFECTGLDLVTKAPVPHPDMKTLVRLDTNEVVEVKPMSEEDFGKRELVDGVSKKPEPAKVEPAAPSAELETPAPDGPSTLERPPTGDAEME